jgi:phage portal protein BeeE
MPLFHRAPPRRAPLHLTGAERAALPDARPSETKASVTPALVSMSMLGEPVWTGYGYAELARQGFASNPIAYRCIRMIAEAAASAPLLVFEDGARAAADHPLQRLLDHPNPEQSGADLLEFFFGALQTGGDGYLQAVG